jgi:hypothetical protein
MTIKMNTGDFVWDMTTDTRLTYMLSTGKTKEQFALRQHKKQLEK